MKKMSSAPIIRIQRDFEWVMKILNEGADVNSINDQGKTPLMCVLKFYDHNRTDIFCKLIRNGADVNARDLNGKTVLMLACKSYYNEELINILLENGADVKCVDKFGNTVLHYVKGYYKEFIHLFIQLGVSVNTKNNDGMTPLGYVVNDRRSLYSSVKIKLLLSLNSDPNTSDTKSNSPIWYAGTDIAVNLLYYYGAKLNAKNKDGEYLLKVILKRDFITDCGAHILRHAVLFHSDELFPEIGNICDYNEYLNNCKPMSGFLSELNKMKTIDIKTDLSFFKFCNLKRRKFNRFVNINEWEYLYDNSEIKKMFPQFYSIIILRLKDNMLDKHRHDLIRNLEKITIKSLNCNYATGCDVTLNYDCLDIICQYLNHKELYNLFLASFQYE